MNTRYYEKYRIQDEDRSMTDVALLQCRGYDLETLREKMAEGLGLTGFPLETFRGARVVVKPNLLSASQPQSAVVTHPQFFQAACEIVLDHGGRPILAESPAVASLRSALRAAGYVPVLKRLGIEAADMSAVRKLSWPGARVMKHFEIAQAFFDADVILNLPKFKTHNLTYITAATKNLFGAVPGMRKSQMHIKFPGKDDFSGFILDLYGAFLHGFDPPKTILHIMDAVIAMEGDGPGSLGRPRPMNAIIVGGDALAVDWVGLQVSGLRVRLCTTVTEGFRRNLGVSSEQEISVKGEKIEDLRVQNFLPPKSAPMIRLLERPAIRRMAKGLFTGRPVPKDGRCMLCYQCREICPAQAIGTAEEGKRVPRFDYGACIRCYCCMEICPKGAISLKKGGLQWMMR
ncbi:MAG TPA: DUF362 domain-containing protein [Deltaproteobacteria bacterium]|jgi:uncharacterized protein (DUF362 family)/NAD-dependent dihydropyrimidine dehydrogenase PreA subunit|nr:DUF362 domain-containing protein [Deltaproteobacteria bacterium]MDI9541421.1 DUF362 domain-containing protein [Pseudomonadota bacterium]HOD71203.1 DUF362 domain-containing protein [Deltaproteobacteria bacterium]HOE71470.1 DUF362 domain-containing protein [Deltaproteobacteria bacterium]HOS26073.1 DUF362 domain-containing protein [Deltaproteobacteria bacterium]